MTHVADRPRQAVARGARPRLIILAVVLTGALLAGCGGGGGTDTTTTAPSGPIAPVSADFLGIVSDDAFTQIRSQRRPTLASQRRTGVQLLRQTFDWSAIERRPGRYDFRRYDDYVHDVAVAGMRVLPVIFRAPKALRAVPAPGVRVTPTTVCPPRNDAALARFATVLVKRYGPDGSYWAAHPGTPKVPITDWQVWNEPNLPEYWCGRPDPAAYAAMLTRAHAAIRGVDPTATVLTAGIPDSDRGIGLQRYVRQLIAAGAAGSFEALAIHPYAADAAGAANAVRQARQLLDDNDSAGAGLWVTEVGWSSGGPRSSFTVGPQRQAQYVLAFITDLARERKALKLRGIVYYNWRDVAPYQGKGDFWGLHTGLLERDGTGKPALSTYYQAAGVIGALPK